MDTKTGVVIARCQVPDLHSGHLALLRDVSSRHHRLIVMLGVARVPNTVTDPLDYQTRVQMMREHVPDAVFYPLGDMPGDNDGWTSQVDRALHLLFPTDQFVLYGGPDSFLPAYGGHWPKVELPIVPQVKRGTDIRLETASYPIDNASFRAGVIYASRNRFQPVHSVIDLAIIKHSDHCRAPEGCRPWVLMGRKASESEAGRYRFIGGFADHKDGNLERAAFREGCEETGNLNFSTPICIGSRKIPDRRYVGTGQSVITSMFYATYVSGHPQASDDMAELGWIQLDKCESMAIGIHKPLAQLLINHFYGNGTTDILHEGVK